MTFVIDMFESDIEKSDTQRKEMGPFGSPLDAARERLEYLFDTEHQILLQKKN